jgi:membrane-anchored glycerophosphoryl diester phosphodiesterase (GDPDase)
VILIAAAVGGFKYFWWFFKICYVSFRSVFKLPQCVEQTTLCISAIKKSERWSNMR